MVVPSPNGAAYPYRVSIVETKQVFVEGIEEVRVFSELAGHLEMSGIQIHPYGGRDKLRQFWRVLASRDDFDNVRSLAVVADADFDVGAARDSIRGALRDAGLPVPSAPLVEASQDDLRVFYLLLPHEKEGMLENVCLESVRSDPAMECVEQFMGCVRDKRQDWPRREIDAKAKVHAFLASQDPPDLRLGEAASKGFWNFDDAAFDPLKELLVSL